MTSSSAWSAIKLVKGVWGLPTPPPELVVHTLRHGFATHLLAGGAHIRQVSAYLGYRSLKPTLVYFHHSLELRSLCLHQRLSIA